MEVNKILRMFRGKRACKGCPFHNKPIIHLQKGRIREIVDGLEGENELFPCHTVAYMTDEPKMQCVGALIFMIKRGTLYNNFAIRLASIFGEFDPDSLKGRSEICDTMEELESLHVIP